jgi:CRP/FNR family cyclic AMP-dependent transcriptional regulator
MNLYEPIGYLASLLVLATFCMRGMAALRAVAIASNLAFIAYGWLVGIHPVLVLHMVLLPTNAWRLMQAVQSERQQARQRRRPRA